MININDVINENKKEAIELLKGLGGHLVFCEDVDEPYGDEPYVLMDFGGDGEITDNMVYEVKLENDSLMIKTRNGWDSISETINSENNVYEAIAARWRVWAKENN